MIGMPSNTLDAVWLSRTVQPRGKNQKPWQKIYILAYNDCLLFRVYNRPDGVLMGNIVEDLHYSRARTVYTAKLQEKLDKGYTKQSITWDRRHEEWSSAMPVPQIAGNVSRLFEPKLETAILESASERIILDLRKTRSGHFRIDHCEPDWQQGKGHLDLPLWQTLFSNEEKARAIFAEVIEKKKELGFQLADFLVSPQQPTGLAGLYPLSRMAATAFKDVQADDWF